MTRKLLLFRQRALMNSFVNFILLFLRLLGINIVKEERFGSYKKKYLNAHSGVSLYFGFWQSEKYFISVREQLIKQFHFQERISVKSLELLPLIQNSNSISIHIRRGDYLQGKHNDMYGGICTEEYYSNAIKYFEDKVLVSCFFVFSDDVEWVKNNMIIPNPVFVDWNNGLDSWQDMFLMSKCKHNIIANSTFSWWGAWLNLYENKIVVAPTRFLNNELTPDLIPQNWIKI